MKYSFLHSTLFVAFCLITCFSSCKKKKDDISPNNPSSSNKVITAFSFTTANNSNYLYADVSGLIGSDSIQLVVPAETDITSLKPTFTFIGSSVSPSTGIAQDFTSPVNYTVTAIDGSTKIYKVVVFFRSTVFISSIDGSFYAFDGQTGNEIWKVANHQFHSGSPSVNKRVVYVCGLDGIYAIDALTGLQKWKYPITTTPTFNDFLPSPIVSNDVVYISIWDGFVYALNASDGSLKWKTQSTSGQGFSSNITLNNNLLYTGNLDNYLYALDVSNGLINWKFLTGGSIYKNPLVVNNNVYTAGLNGAGNFLNGSNGNIIWSFAGNDFHMSSPIYFNGVIYCGGGTRATGYDITNGTIQWNLLIPLPGGGTNNERSSPAIYNGNFYAGSNNGSFYAYDLLTKTQKWSFPTAGYFVYSSPVIADGLVYIGSADQSVYAVDAITGSLKWRKSTGGAVTGSACAIDRKGIKHYPGISGEEN